MLSRSEKLLVPDAITELKIVRTMEGQQLVLGGPWGSAEVPIPAPLVLKRVDGPKGGRCRQRDVTFRAVSKAQGSTSVPQSTEMNPLEPPQPSRMYMEGNVELRRSKRMHSSLCAYIEDVRRSCARGSHYGFIIEGLGWRASARSGKEVPGGESIPMQVEKPGKPRVVPQVPPGLKVKEDARFLELKIGNAHYSHFRLKEGWRATTDDYKGQRFVISGGGSTSAVGQLAARVRSTRVPEPYKGKGIRYQSEKVLRKEGKLAQ